MTTAHVPTPPWLPAGTPAAPLGASWQGGDRTHFLVWAPHAQRVEVVFDGGRRSPLEPRPHGYHEATLDGAAPGTRYRFSLNGAEPRPDPASRWQPDGVHGSSVVTDPAFSWSDADWRGVALRDLVLYELHVGTFTRGGTFDTAIAELPRLRELGVTAVEIMPVAQFPGTRNWGYDGVLPFSAQNSYGGPESLRRLVDAAHASGLAVCLDVVYNHLGPEGNHLAEFAPYFTDRYRTPWGRAVNFDDAASDHVRHFFIENALYWIDDCHVDALRLDAVHAIFDASARPFLRELAGAVHARAGRLGRTVLVIAESDLNDPRMVSPAEAGGYGLDAQWSDDFHHALHALLTGERAGYYGDFGTAAHLARAYDDAYVYAGDYSGYRGRRHGAPALHLPHERFVVCAQNHDQVGNRRDGDRLATLVAADAHRLAAAATLLSPFTPLLFMGEEYGEVAPFQYFVHHSDPALIDAVRRGRHAEFAGFAWGGEPPDPQAAETFERCRLDPALRERAPHAQLLALTHELLRLRRAVPALAAGGATGAEARDDGVLVHRTHGEDRALLALNFGSATAELPPHARGWRRVLDTADRRWGGPGAGASDVPPRSAVLLTDR